MATSGSTPTGTDTGPQPTGDDSLSIRAAANVVRLSARIKPWPAYLLATCWPGAGHFYRRQWARGCSWVALYGAALVVLSSGTLLAAGSVTDPLLVTTLRLETVNFGDVAMPLAILVLSMLDLYALASLDDLA
ncbi:hypothetical protein [Natrinema soli]|uniref:Uncharacterized protein n=1 Tax=Natrinema soli TaxID=1930624 RepID=A0ABD5SMS0_9EURY|nr:hypothetical protein [Natrinema soli]